MIYGRYPTVAEYYSEHINKSVDLTSSPKQCCPFHDEDTPSFSYNLKTGRWSCFGKCHAHGGVEEMHKRHFHFPTIEEAIADLNSRYQVKEKTIEDKIRDVNMTVINEEKIEEEALYSLAVTLANTVERWLELDLVMSYYPLDTIELQVLVNRWRGIKSLLED